MYAVLNLNRTYHTTPTFSSLLQHTFVEDGKPTQLVRPIFLQLVGVMQQSLGVLYLALVVSMLANIISFSQWMNSVLSTTGSSQQKCTPVVQNHEPPPLQVFPLLKELHAGWQNMETPPLLNKNATGTRSLIVDLGLDGGKEFFVSMANGFEVVGLEPSPVTFPKLAKQCAAIPNDKCVVINDVHKIALPLSRAEGVSYLINAGAGEVDSEMVLHLNGPMSTFSNFTKDSKHSQTVPIIRIDKLIQEDVYLLKIDVQGMEQSVLKGAENLFTNHVVRQLIFEVDSKLASSVGVVFLDLVRLVTRDYGMLCFTTRTDFPGISSYGVHAELAEKFYEAELENCWSSSCVLKQHKRSGPVWWGKFDDFLCINPRKAWSGPVLPQLPPRNN